MSFIDTPVFSEKKRPLKKMQQHHNDILLLINLHHADLCPHPPDAPDICLKHIFIPAYLLPQPSAEPKESLLHKTCASSKALFAHFTTCTEPLPCAFPLCSKAKSVAVHFNQCKTTTCNVCPVARRSFSYASKKNAALAALTLCQLSK